MKKILLTLVSAFIFSHCFSQEASNVIKAGYGGLGFEHAFTDHFSVLVSVPVSFAVASSGLASGSALGLGLEADLRFYPLNNRVAPAGLYISPGAGYLFGSAKVSDGMGDTEKSSYNVYYGKGVLGYQWVWGSGFTLDLNAGVGYFNFKYNSDADAFQGYKAAEITPVLGLAIGYAF